MMTDVAKVIVKNGVELTEHQKKEAADAALWLQNWLKNRHDNNLFADSEDAYQSAMNKLKRVKIVFTDNIVDSMKDEIEKGNLHVSSRLTELNGDSTEKILSDIQKGFQTSQDNTGSIASCPSEYFEEPIVFIDMKKFNEYSGDNRLPSISSLVTHELTHAIHLSKSEDISEEVISTLNNGVGYAARFDSGVEKYGRLMQLRHDLGLEAQATLSIEDVQKLRQLCVDRKVERCIDSYSDEQLQKILNVKPEDDIFLKHNDLSALRHFAQGYNITEYTPEVLDKIRNYALDNATKKSIHDDCGRNKNKLIQKLNQLDTVQNIFSNYSSEQILQALKFDKNNNLGDGDNPYLLSDNIKNDLVHLSRLKKDAGLEENQILNIEDIKQIRSFCQQRRENRGDSKEWNIDSRIFERYSDEEIANALRLTAEYNPINDMHKNDLRSSLKNDYLLAMTKINLFEKQNINSLPPIEKGQTFPIAHRSMKNLDLALLERSRDMS